MFSVAFEEYNSVQAMVIALPGDIQPVAAVIAVGMAGMAAIAILVVIVAAAVVATGKRKLLYYLRQQTMKALGTICKHTFWAVFLGLALILFPLPSFAITVQDVPNPQKDNGGWVTDLAQILSPDTEAKLNKIISELKGQTGDEIAIVTVPETTPASSPKAFTTKLFNYWGIGKSNGVLFLVSKGDRRIEIQTSYAIESLLPDAQVSDIIKTEIIPQFKQGNLESGILAGTKSLVTKLGGNLATLENLLVNTNNRDTSNQQSGYVALGILVIAALVLPSYWYFASISRRGGVTDIGSGDSSGGAGGD